MLKVKSDGKRLIRMSFFSGLSVKYIYSLRKNI